MNTRLLSVSMLLALAAAASAQQAPRAPIGSPTPVAAGASPGAFFYHEGLQTYVMPLAVTAGLNTDFHLVFINADTGVATPTYGIETDPLTNTVMPTATWNAGAGRCLFTYRLARGANEELRGMIWDAAGPVGAGSFVIVANMVRPPAGDLAYYSVASDGQDWMVVYATPGLGTAGLSAVKVDRASTNSAVVPMTPFIVETALGVSEPRIAYLGGQNYIVSWWQGQNLRRRIVPASGIGLGQVITTSTTRTIPTNCRMGLAADASTNEAVIMWLEDGYNPQNQYVHDVMAQRIIADGSAPQAAFIVNTGAPVIAKMEVVWSDEADQYVALWLTTAGTQQELWTAGIGLDGRMLPQAPPLKLFGAFPPATTTNPPLRAVLRQGENQIAVAFTANQVGGSGTYVHRFTPGPSPLKPVVTGFAQRPIDGGFAMPAGATTKRAGVIVESSVVDPGGVLVRIQLEMREAGQGWTGAATQTSDWASGFQNLPIPVVLPRGTSWSWRVRAQNLNLKYSPWQEFGANPQAAPDFTIRTNAVPGAGPVSLTDPATGRSIRFGEKLNEVEVAVSATVSDADIDDHVRLEVECRAPGEAFTGEPTELGSFVTPNEVAGLTLQPPEGATFLRVRTMDDAGDPSAWVALPSAGTPAFTRHPFGSIMGSSGCLQSTPGGAGLLALLALAVLRRR